MKRFLIFLLFTTLLFSACNDSSHTAVTTENTTDPPEEIRYLGAITDYTIIVPEKEDGYNSGVLSFRSELYRLTNVRIDFRTDRLSDNDIDREVPYEILIGDTNRAESAEASQGLNKGDYRIRAVGKKLVIGGGSDSDIQNALSKLTELFVKEESLMVPENFEYLHRFDGKKIACMGDSITFGLAATSENKTYPAVLQSLLGEDYHVGNFGRSGASAIYSFEQVSNAPNPIPYFTSTEYRQAKEFSPDIVILMLGMNDANPTHSFSAGNGGVMSEACLTLYRENLTTIINSVRSFDSAPVVYLAVTTPMTRQVGTQYSQDYVTNFTNNLVKLRQIQREVAAELGVTLIETEAVLNDSTHFADGCHLSDKGYAALAAHFATFLTK